MTAARTGGVGIRLRWLVSNAVCTYGFVRFARIQRWCWLAVRWPGSMPATRWSDGGFGRAWPSAMQGTGREGRGHVGRRGRRGAQRRARTREVVALATAATCPAARSFGSDGVGGYGHQIERGREGFREGAHSGCVEQLSSLEDGSALPELMATIDRAEDDGDDAWLDAGGVLAPTGGLMQHRG